MAAKNVFGMPQADGVTDILVVHFDQRPPTFARDVGLDESIKGYRQWYEAKAKAFLDALQDHAPQGFVDHVFAELCARKASVYRVR